MLQSTQGTPLGGVATFRSAQPVTGSATLPSSPARLSDKVHYDIPVTRNHRHAAPHAGVFQRSMQRVSAWLDRVIAADERIICTACDDRFWTQEDGLAHVARCHPEYRGVMLYDETVRSAGGNLRLAPARVAHNRY